MPGSFTQIENYNQWSQYKCDSQKGKWVVAQYELEEETDLIKRTTLGMRIRITFKPKNYTTALDKIGLIQAVLRIKDNEPTWTPNRGRKDFIKRKTENMLNTTNEEMVALGLREKMQGGRIHWQDCGIYIDQPIARKSPFYASTHEFVKHVHGDEKLSISSANISSLYDTIDFAPRKSESKIQENPSDPFNYMAGFGSSNSNSFAFLYDKPNIGSISKDNIGLNKISGQFFETIAFGMNAHSHKVLGSIMWGWYEENGDFHLLEPVLVSENSYTIFFKAAAEAWNSNSKRIRIPQPQHPVATIPNQMSRLARFLVDNESIADWLYRNRWRFTGVVATAFATFLGGIIINKK